MLSVKEIVVSVHLLPKLILLSSLVEIGVLSAYIFVFCLLK